MPPERMKLLFVKARLEWPRTYGHDVHCYEMMRALAAQGHEVALVTDAEPTSEALAGLPLAARWVLEDRADASIALTYLQERYRSYWGIARGRIAHLRAVAEDWQADVVVVVGLEILPYLAAPTRATRVWYAADEWVWHYVTQLRSDPGDAITCLRQAAIKGLYERAYGPLMDRVWVVSDVERRAMRIVAGARHVDVLPNGVDTSYFAPSTTAPAVEPHSAVFWGRLGFGPNLQALRWFCGSVWPLVRQQIPDASFAIVGADPPREIQAHHGTNGITVVANPIDIRPAISTHAVVVMPFVSGGGIKNKFLEAAAMGQPIVTTRRGTQGLRTEPPVRVADTPADFAASVVALWRDPHAAAALGANARLWVTTHHTWAATAAAAVAALDAHKR